jgi:hypothetical protein
MSNVVAGKSLLKRTTLPRALDRDPRKILYSGGALSWHEMHKRF